MKHFFVPLFYLLTLCLQPPNLHGAVKGYQITNAAVSSRIEQLTTEPCASWFSPPEGWLVADPSKLPKTVRLMVIGKGRKEFPPSINLATEKYTGTLSEYLKIVKEINSSQGAEWKSLGTVDTESGTAHLSQLDVTNEWGKVRMIHILLLKDDVMHIMTGASLKEEFPKYRTTFLQAMRSIHVNQAPFDMVLDETRRQDLEIACEKVKNEWSATLENVPGKVGEKPKTSAVNALFAGEQFQKQSWQPFEQTIADNYSDMNQYWQKYLLTMVKEQLLGCEKPAFATLKQVISGTIGTTIGTPVGSTIGGTIGMALSSPRIAEAQADDLEATAEMMMTEPGEASCD